MRASARLRSVLRSLVTPTVVVGLCLTSLPAEAASPPDRAGPVDLASATAQASTAAKPASRARASARGQLDGWTGFAFDACRAPSNRVMDRWRVASPFLGVGVYIGGGLRACPQRNLTRRWVSRQSRLGWKILPIWVGPQASCTSYRQRISSSPGARGRFPRARTQGVQAARGARAAAGRLGLKRGSTLWYDLEYFPARRSTCRRAALHFLSSWTRELHRHGYRSGVYSSVSAGIAALGRARHRRAFTAPDRVWFAWANGRRDAWLGNRWVRAPRWKQDRRVHQYALDVVASYGGKRMHIDRNYVALGGSPRVRRTPAVCGSTADRQTYGALHRGDRGPRVKAAQCLLKAAGRYRGEVGGSYGAETKKATRSFQRSRGLRATGRINGRTWTALLANGSRPVLKRGSEGPPVRRAQRALTAALPGAVPVHGHFGPRTGHAVRRYQARAGLRVSGVLSPGTWRALRSGKVVKVRSKSVRPAKHGKSAKHGKAKRHRKGGKRR